MPEGAPGSYLRRGSAAACVAAISSQMEDAPPATWNTYIWVDSADETAAKVREAGGSVLSEPIDIFDSGRMATFADPEGAAFGVWQPNQHRGAAVVNEPGSVNFNGLHTRDLEGAKAFYGAVFGWEALPMGMWALPAYGDHLEALNPGTRARTEEMGGPTRFEEVVAAVTVIADDQRRRRTGTSRSGSPTPTRSPRAPRSSAGRSSCRRSTRRGSAGRSSATPRARRSTRTSSCPRTRTSAGAGRLAGYGVISARSAVAVSRSTTASSGRPRPV